MIFIIDDNKIMAECIKRAAGREAKIFSNAIEAMNEIIGGVMPELIFLDILLDGPDGFAFLNEMTSYADTAKIPIVITTLLELPKSNYEVYGVVGIMNKEKMRPEDVSDYVKQYCK